MRFALRLRSGQAYCALRGLDELRGILDELGEEAEA